MKKLALSVAAVITASMFAMPSYAEGTGGDCDGNGVDTVCKLKLKAKVKEECSCNFTSEYLDFDWLRYDVSKTQSTQMELHCNTKYAKVTVGSMYGGLVGDYGDAIIWDMYYGGEMRYSSADGSYTFEKVPTHDSPYELSIKTRPFDFYKVAPGYKHDYMVMTVSPAFY